MTEAEGCTLLRALFEEAGLRIEPDYPFDEDGVRVVLDGFDPQARIGFEYITDEARDRREFTPEVVARLEEAMARGSLALLLVDEPGAGEGSLRFAARAFLARARGGRP